MKRFIQILAVAMFLGASQAINNCKQYETCPECLDLNKTRIDGFGTHPDCGWCHVPITYEDGHQGARCADIRDDPWNCGDQYDTATCSPGWACDVNTHKCIMANPGEGFGAKSTCENYCQGPGPVPQDQYRCNTTSYICEKCKEGDTGCSPDRAAQCDNCKDPNPPDQGLYKCNKTNPDQPTCDKCTNSTSGCTSKANACQQCHPKSKLFECDPKTLTCVQAKDGGNIKQACDAACGHITPQELLGTWRGLEAKKGQPPNFEMGEIDLIFGDKNLTVKYPNRTQDIYDVSTTGGSTFTLTKGNHTIKVVHNVLSYLTHTIAAGLSTFGPEKDAPDSFRRGMESDKALDLVMWKCNTWGGSGTCNFSPNKTEEIVEESQDLVVVDDVQDGTNDACNNYGDCHTCIGEHDGVKCGWCLGGTLSYRNVGKTPFKCGGFKAGTPFNFTCPADFRTTDCKGYSCDFKTKQCAMTSDGQFPDAESCHDACSKDVQFSKCNHDTNKCESCDEGSDGCNTAAFCSATCGKPHAKCHPSNGTCSACDPATDKSCTQIKTACDQECSKMELSKCNSDTGKCEKCEDGGTGCVPTAGCEETCSIKPHENPYKCNWQSGHPTCMQDPDGTMNKTECAQTCEEPSFGKCDFKNNTCVKCDHTKDKECIQTMDFCKIAQERGDCKAQKLNGLFRMIEVNPNYDVGEFDVMFKDGKMYMQEFVTKVDAKDLGTISHTGSAEGGAVTFEVDDWKPEPKIWNHDKLFGAYKTSKGESQTFTFLEMAFSDKQVTKLDDGLKGRYFVGIGCMDKKICDFTKATPAENQSSQYAKYKFFLG